MQLSPVQYYEQQIGRYVLDLKKTQARSSLVAILRLLSFSFVLITGYLWLYKNTAGAREGCFALLAIFILLVLIALRLSDRKRLIEKLLFINTNEANVVFSHPNDFPNG